MKRKKYTSKQVAAMKLKTTVIKHDDQKINKNARKQIAELQKAEDEDRVILRTGKKEMTDIKKLRKVEDC